MQGFEGTIAAAQNKDVNDEAGSVVNFYDRPIMNKFKSNEEGRPTYDSKLFVKIITLGQSHSIVDCEKKPEHEKRYPAAWQRYLDKDTTGLDGTPIDMWQAISRAQAAELKHINVLTVEHLAKVADANLVNLGPSALGLREMARNFLAGESEKSVELTEVLALVADLRSEIDELKAAAAKPTRKKPGPKPKESVPDDTAEHSPEHA